MVRCRLFPSLLVSSLTIAVYLAGAARPVAAQDTLQSIPEGTAIVLRLASVDRVVGGTGDMLRAIGGVAAGAAGQIELGVGGMLNVPRLEGVDRTRPVYVTVFPLKEGEPVAWYVPTKDRDALLRGLLGAAQDAALAPQALPNGFQKIELNRTMWFRHENDVLLYTFNEKVMESLAAESSKKPLTASVESRVLESFQAGDVSVLLNAGTLNEMFKAELDGAEQEARRGIEQIPDESLGASGDPQAIKKLYSQLLETGFVAVRDTQWAAGNLRLSAEGAEAAGLAVVKTESATDSLLAAGSPSALDNLGLLPAGAPAYFGADISAKAMYEWSNMAQGLYTSDPAKQAAQAAGIEAAVKAGQGAVVGSFAMPSSPTSGMLSAMLFAAKDASALQSAFRTLYESVGQIKTPVFTQSIQYKQDAETYKDRSLDLATQKWEFSSGADPGLAIAQQFIKKMFGGDALQSRVTAVDELLVQVTSNDPQNIHKLLDSLESGEGIIGLEAAYSQTRDKLAPEANFLAMVNAPQLVVDVFRMIKDVPPFNAFLGQLPFNFGLQPPVSYAGASLGTAPQAIRLQVFVPIQQPKALLQFFGQGG